MIVIWLEVIVLVKRLYYWNLSEQNITIDDDSKYFRQTGLFKLLSFEIYGKIIWSIMFYCLTALLMPRLLIKVQFLVM